MGRSLIEPHSAVHQQIYMHGLPVCVCVGGGGGALLRKAHLVYYGL